MPRKSQVASVEECCEKCENDITELRKEVALLKTRISKIPVDRGGDDPRVSQLIDALKNISSGWKNKIEKSGL